MYCGPSQQTSVTGSRVIFILSFPINVGLNLRVLLNLFNWYGDVRGIVHNSACAETVEAVIATRHLQSKRFYVNLIQLKY
jgi:hypothetical protein